MRTFFLDLLVKFLAPALNPIISPVGGNGDDLPWDGVDDTWPEEPQQETPKPDSEPWVTEVTLAQWGLCLPDGTISWGNWQNIPFDNPLDRMRAVATLQKAALSVGFAEGEQMSEFLGKYGWVTRDAHVRTQFSPVTAHFVLGDMAAAEVTTNGQVKGDE